MQIPQSPKSFWVKHQRWKHHGVLLTSSYRPTVAKAVWYWHRIRHKDRRPKTGYLGRNLHSYSHPGFIFVCLVVFNNLSAWLFLIICPLPFFHLILDRIGEGKKSSPLNTYAGKLGVHTRKLEVDSLLAFVCLGFCCFGWLGSFLLCLFIFVWRQDFSYNSSDCPWTHFTL